MLGDKQGNLLTWRLDAVDSKPARLGAHIAKAVVCLAASPSDNYQVSARGLDKH